jgi:hypothetical protein
MIFLKEKEAKSMPFLEKHTPLLKKGKIKNSHCCC